MGHLNGARNAILPIKIPWGATESSIRRGPPRERVPQFMNKDTAHALLLLPMLSRTPGPTDTNAERLSHKSCFSDGTGGGAGQRLFQRFQARRHRESNPTNNCSALWQRQGKNPQSKNTSSLAQASLARSVTSRCQRLRHRGLRRRLRLLVDRSAGRPACGSAIAFFLLHRSFARRCFQLFRRLCRRDTRADRLDIETAK